jgi:flagellar motor switch protein FliG
MAQILRRSSPNLTLLALAGASHDFVRQILAQLPSREAAQLDRRIQQIGPLRLDDVQRAQQQLADIAQQLIDEGQIVLPGQPRFAVAA